MDKAVNSLPRIFVSHSVTDNEFAAKLVADLQRAIGDIDAVWYDVSGLRGGDMWWDKILEELTASDIFIIVLTPNSVVSRWVIRELNTAINEGKRVVPVLYQPCKIRADLKTIQMISFLSPKAYETAFKELCTALGIVEQLPKVVTPPAPSSPVIPRTDQTSPQTGGNTTDNQAPPPIGIIPPSKSYGVTIPPKAPWPRHGISHVSRTRVILLAGLAILVITAGIFGFSFFFGGNQGNYTPGNATMTANAHVTATYQAYDNAAATIKAQVNAKATATANLEPQVNATATAFAPTVTAATTTSQNPYPAHVGTMTLNDPLRDNKYGWYENDNCGFTGSAYHVSGSGQYVNVCFAKSTNYSNFAFQVQVTIIKGGCGGLVFRADNTSFKFYMFDVCTDGTYSLTSYTSAGSTWLISPTIFAAIHTYPNQANVLAVVASGSKFDLYINLEHTTSVNDSTYNHGQIGVAAFSVQSDQSDVEVAFSNVKVWAL